MKLLQFLFDRWSNNPSGLSGGRTLVLSGGFEERGKVVSIPVAQNYQQPDVSFHELSCNHEEADTRLFVHISACAKKGMKRIIIRASDTDITVVAIYKYPKLANLGLEELFIKTPGYFIPIHRISQVVTANQASSLPLMHALSGCDTSSFFFGKGKSTFWSASKQNIESQAADICADLEVQNAITDGIVNTVVEMGTKLIKEVYQSGDFPDLNSLRVHLYARKADLKLPPPTEDTFRLHVLRALLQTFIWVKADQPIVVIPDPFKFGWISTSNGVKPLLMLRAACPPNLDKTVFCKCKQRCSRNCSCKKKQIPCDSLCLCKGNPETCSHSVLVIQENELQL